MSSSRVLSVSDARAQLAELVNLVAYGGEQITLTRHGRAVAVLVSVADAETARASAVPSAGPAEVRSLTGPRPGDHGSSGPERRIAAQVKDPSAGGLGGVRERGPGCRC